MQTGWKFVGYDKCGRMSYTLFKDHLHAELLHRDIEDFMREYKDIHHVEATFVYFPASIGQEEA